MIFNLGESDDRYWQRMSQWHKKFVLWPRRIGNKNEDIYVWLQWVETRTYCIAREAGHSYWQTDYRLPK